MLLEVVCFLSLGVYITSMYSGCCDFCLICDACSFRCSWSGSILVSLCRCCVFVYCVHPFAVFKAAFSLV